MKFKKHLSLLLSVALSLSAFVPMTAFADNEDAETAEIAETVAVEEDNVEAAEVLAALGVMDYPSKSKAWSKVTMNKGDFIKTVLAMTDYAGTEYSGVILPWENIEVGSTYYNEFMYSYMKGYLSENDDVGEAEDLVTPEFAIKYVQNMLGYHDIIIDKISNASKVQKALRKGVTGNADGNLTLNGILTLMYNATKIDYCKVQYAGSKYGVITGYTVRDGRTILTEFKDIYMIKGRVNATHYATLNGETAGENRLVINSDVFECYDEAYETMIGRNVEGYAHIDDVESKILWMTYQSSTEDIVIEGEDFVSFDGTSVTYETERGTRKRTTVTNPVIIYNGRTLQSGEYSDSLFDIIDGNVTLIDNRGDISTIIITKYSNMVIGAVDATNQKLYDMIYTGNPLVLNAASTVVIKNTSGQQIDFSELKAKDVLTYTMSMDGTYFVGTVGGSKINGNITRQDPDEKYVTANGVDYPYTQEFENAQQTLSFDAQYTFYINIYGRLVGVKNLSGSTGNMAFIMKAVLDDESDCVNLRVIPQDAATADDTVWLQCTQKVTVDGETCTGNGVLVALGKINQSVAKEVELPIIYDLNADGLVKRIDTPYYNAASEDKDSTLQRVYTQSQGTIYSKTDYDNGFKGQINGQWLVDASALVLNSIGSHEFNIASGSGNDTHYKRDIYTIGIDSPLAMCVVQSNPNAETGEYENGFAVVKSKYITVNADNEAVLRVTLSMSGKDNEYDVAVSKRETIEPTLKRGNLIRYGFDAKGNLSNTQVILDYEDMDSSIGYEYPYKVWNTNNQNPYIVVGKVYDVTETSNGKYAIRFYKDKGDITGSLQVTYPRGLQFYELNDANEVTTSDILPTQIKTYKQVGSNADMLVMMSTYHNPYTIYIVSVK